MFSDDSRLLLYQITHDSGSTEDRESGVITPASSRLLVRIPQCQINWLITSMPRRIWSMIDVPIHATSNHELVNVSKLQIEKCRSVLYTAIYDKVIYSKNMHFVRVLKTRKTILCDNLNKILPLLFLYDFLLLMVQNFCPLVYIFSLTNKHQKRC